MSVFHQNGVEAAPVNEVAMRFVAKKPGRVQITLVAKITQSLQSTGQFQLDRDKQFQDQVPKSARFYLRTRCIQPISRSSSRCSKT